METQTRLSRHNKFISAENIVGIFSVSSDDSFYIYAHIHIHTHTQLYMYVYRQAAYVSLCTNALWKSINSSVLLTIGK